MNKFAKIAVFSLLALLLLGLAGFVIWAANPLGPMPEALAALESDDQIEVISDDWLTFEPRGTTPSIGLIFYPGGRVDYRSYAPLARLVALHGYRVILVPMPLNLAVFDPDRAADVIAANPDIDAWVIAGHSLGGAMAASFTHDNPELIDGLIFLAAYPADADNLSTSPVFATSIYGLNDGVSPPERIEASEPMLPANTLWSPIEGGNHAQFGWYGPQPGDNEATISREEQQNAALEAVLETLLHIPSASPQVIGQVDTVFLH